MTVLAMLRVTKISPGSVPVISLAGTRLSEQPIHKKSGFCTSDVWSKKCLSSITFCATQALLLRSKRSTFFNFSILFSQLIKQGLDFNFYKLHGDIFGAGIFQKVANGFADVHIHKHGAASVDHHLRTAFNGAESIAKGSLV